jgi:phi LC3 family holin
MKINWKIRFKNPMFLVQIVVSIMAPVLAYLGMGYSDLVTWADVGNVFVTAFTNPYVLGLMLISVYNTIIDPTTEGMSDSERALSYTSLGGNSKDVK